MAEPGRRTFGPALLAGLAGAGLAAFAGNRPWVEPDSDAAAGAAAQVATIASDASSPLTTAVALVVLASWGVVLVTRGGFRRAVAGLAALASLALVVVVALGWLAAPDELQDLMASYRVEGVEVRRTAWSWLALVAAPVALGAALLAVRDVGHWPQMGSRYDAPADAGATATDDAPAAERSNLELWKQLDEGTDPTDR